MKRTYLCLLAGCMLGAAPIHAGESAVSRPPTALTKNLGQGLVYHLVTQLPADLPTTEARPVSAAILDLRFARGDAGGGSALVAWLEFHAKPPSPVFVLINAATDQPILRALSQRSRPGSVLTLGPATDGYTPDLIIANSAENEHHTHEALRGGADPLTLVTENTDKTRNDEASLGRERSAESATASRDRTGAGRVDAALQRAVHLHRAVQALKKP